MVFYVVDLRPDKSARPAGDIVSVEYHRYKKPAKASPAPVVKPVAPVHVIKKAVKPTKTVKHHTAPVQAVSAKPAESKPVESQSAEHESAAVMAAPQQTAAKAKPAVSAAPIPDIPSFSDTRLLKEHYREKVRDIIASNKEYPVIARRRGVQGKVVVAFSVKKNGEIYGKSVISSSGFDMLDSTAIAILAKSSPLPVPPERMDFQLPISFRLN